MRASHAVAGLGPPPLVRGEPDLALRPAGPQQNQTSNERERREQERCTLSPSIRSVVNILSMIILDLQAQVVLSPETDSCPALRLSISIGGVSMRDQTSSGLLSPG
ncbi:hypothetical protein VTN02DRAFT_4631 [Thermoascus thermophilus]